MKILQKRNKTLVAHIKIITKIINLFIILNINFLTFIWLSGITEFALYTRLYLLNCNNIKNLNFMD